MSFIRDFLDFSSGTECQPTYLRWASLMPVAIAAGRRYFLRQGRLIIRPELCLCLVGPSGSKKTFAKDLAMDVVTFAMPDMPIGADITSRDDLIRLIASKDTLRFYINHEGAECEWHPMSLFIDEIRHFMSYSPSAMIAFLVAIYGRNRFQSSTIKRGVEDIVEPCLNLIGCTTPDWITEHLKTGILAGGWSRRFIVVYEPELPKVYVAIPHDHIDSALLKKRMNDQMVKIQANAGEFIWMPGTTEWFTNWYIQNRKSLPDNEHEQAFFLTKDKHLLKVAMLMALAEPDTFSSEKPKLEITVDLLEQSLAMFTLIEDKLPKLYLAAGRNELALPQQKVLDLIARHKGGLPKKTLMCAIDKDFSPMEQISMLRHLQDSDRVKIAIVAQNGVKDEWVMLPEFYKKIVASNGKTA